MSRKVRQRLQPVPGLLFILFISSSPLVPLQAAGTDPTSQKQKEITITIGKLNVEMKIQQKKIRQSAAQEISVLDELEQLDGKLQQQRKKISELEKSLQAQVKLLARKEQELKQAENNRDILLRHLQKRLRSYYQVGKTDILDVTFSNRNLPELMLFTDAYKQLISYDQAIIDSYRATVIELERAKQAQELEKALLQNFIRQAEEEQQTLHALRVKQETLLARIKTQKGLYELALQEMHRAEDKLEQTLAQIKHNEEIKKRGFQLSKGKLPPPVKGTLVLKFDEIAEDGLGKGNKAKGITIATAADAPVHAVYKGKVIFAGYRRGYGNMVIIDHGFKYYTVTSRLDTIMVKEGDRVSQATQIGSTGDMATLFARGLYFEVRVGSTPQDPLQWLQQGTYSAAR